MKTRNCSRQAITGDEKELLQLEVGIGYLIYKVWDEYGISPHQMAARAFEEANYHLEAAKMRELHEDTLIG